LKWLLQIPVATVLLVPQPLKHWLIPVSSLLLGLLAPAHQWLLTQFSLLQEFQ
jgi:hypothetical protein